MSKLVVLDELHVTFRIPASLPAPAVRAIRRTLTGQAFTAAVRQAVMAQMKRHPVMTPVQVTVTR